jgi:hypothetical protein
MWCVAGLTEDYIAKMEDVLASESKGQYCRRHILQHFPYDRIPRTFRKRELTYISRRNRSAQNPSACAAADLQLAGDLGFADAGTM